MNFTCNQLAKRHLECCSTAPSITSWQIFSELFGFSSAKNSKSHIMRKVLQGKNELHFFFPGVLPLDRTDGPEHSKCQPGVSMALMTFSFFFFFLSSFSPPSSLLSFSSCLPFLFLVFDPPFFPSFLNEETQHYLIKPSQLIWEVLSALGV